MTSPNLPPVVLEHLAARLTAARRAPLQAAQAAMSAIYRDGGHSREAVPDAAAALAYAVARMPATYAACVRAFDLAAHRMPEFAPHSLRDLGAGPGTAALAAAAVWPALTTAHLIEPNPSLAAVATDLLATASTLAHTSDAADMRRLPPPTGPAADLVTLSYVLAEQRAEDIAPMLAQVASHVGRLIVVLEPGTPAGFARILKAREALSAAGLHIVAPCPHMHACPLPSGDWCHFSVRLQRSSAHMQLKDATVPFEDERFSFVAAVRDTGIAPAACRLIRPATIEKGFADLTLCTVGGLESRRVRKRDGAAYKAAKALQWGDEV